MAVVSPYLSIFNLSVSKFNSLIRRNRMDKNKIQWYSHISLNDADRMSEWLEKDISSKW